MDVANHSCLGYTETVFPRISRHTVFLNSTQLFILWKCKNLKSVFFPCRIVHSIWATKKWALISLTLILRAFRHLETPGYADHDASPLKFLRPQLPRFNEFRQLLLMDVAGLLKTLELNRPLPPNSFFFRQKQPLLFSLLLLSSSSLFFFLLSFQFLGWFCSLSGAKKPVFWFFFTQTAANFAWFVFKKSARYIFIYTV